MLYRMPDGLKVRSPDRYSRTNVRRFYRGAAARNQPSESNGLGLAIVTAIMDIHSGHARAQTRDDGRIEFHLEFPSHTQL